MSSNGQGPLPAALKSWIDNCVVPIGRPARTVGGEELGPGPMTIVQDFHIEGMISPDVLDEVIEQISERVRHNDR